MIRRLNVLLIPVFALALIGCAVPPVAPTPTPVVPVVAPTTNPAPVVVTPPVVPPGPPATTVVVTPATWFSNNQAWLIPLLTLLGGGTGTTIAHALLTYFAGGKPTGATALQAAIPLLTQLAQADPKDAAKIAALQAGLQLMLAARAAAPANPPAPPAA